MNITYFNGSYLDKEEVHISPDDRGFLFADGIYEVVRWYEGFFYDMEAHIARLKRSLKEVRIEWPEADSFGTIAAKLIADNGLSDTPSLVYLQVTRGAAKRNHAFPQPSIPPTVYSFAWGFRPANELIAKGIRAIMKKEIRWARCDIKSVSLLPNILSFQESLDAGAHECIFVRDGIVTECAHSNVFFVIDGVIRTHPESDAILSGVSRKNAIRLARKHGIPLAEEALREEDVKRADEAFITNTSFEIAPVIAINNLPVGDGKPGPVTMNLRSIFLEEIHTLKSRII